MSKLDHVIEQALKTYSLGLDACWLHKQSNKYILSHWACENIAIQECILWEPPQIIHADPEKKIATICVTGKLGERVEWSFGEAAPYNNQQSYPFAMAEKRAKDRVILKLIGLSGKVYSEEEADDFKAPPPESKPEQKPKHGQMQGPRNITALKADMRAFAHDLEGCADIDSLNGLVQDNKELLDQCERDLPDWFLGVKGSDVKGAQARIAERVTELSNQPHRLLAAG